MNLPDKIRFAIRDLFAPSPEARFGQMRSLRMTIFAILGGIIIAVAFGFILYYLNRNGRITR